jgi:hypothetical protein
MIGCQLASQPLLKRDYLRMNPPAEQLIRDYLNGVSVAAGDSLGAAGRRVLLAKTREHIERRVGNPARASEADVARVLATLGPPAALVERARNALAGTSAPAVGYASNGRAPHDGPDGNGRRTQLARAVSGSGSAGGGRQVATRLIAPLRSARPALAGARRAAAAVAGRAARATARQVRRHPLEVIAVALQGVGGLLFPPVWLLGALVALPSRVWDFRDKWAGLGGPVGLVIVGTWIIATLDSSHGTVAAYLHQVWASGGYLSRIAAVLGAAYLGWRLRQGPRQLTPPWARPPQDR